MKKHIKNILAYTLGTLYFITLVLVAQALYGYLLQREGNIAILKIGIPILISGIILGFLTWKDIPAIKKLGSKN